MVGQPRQRWALVDNGIELRGQKAMNSKLVTNGTRMVHTMGTTLVFNEAFIHSCFRLPAMMVKRSGKREKYLQRMKITDHVELLS
jgi:hypothetical protein